MTKISVIGGGSVIFSGVLIKDLCLNRNLAGSTITFMDISKERLDFVLSLASRYAEETGADFNFEITTDRKKALQGSDFVINTVKVGGYAGMEAERDISENHGYYRGIDDRVCDYYGGIAAYHQLKFAFDLAKDIENICPQAWLLQAANPVFEVTNLLIRETGVKAVGCCHGYNGYKNIINVLGLDEEHVHVQAAGLNHNIFMTKFMYKGKDAYPILNKWIEEDSVKYWESPEYLHDPWNAELSPSAIEMYKYFDLFPLGDTVRVGPLWWHHSSLKEKAKWLPAGGPDSEVGWTMHLNRLTRGLGMMRKMAADPNTKLTTIYPPVSSDEPFVPFIDAIANGNTARLALNVANKGTIQGLPDDVAIEVNVKVDKNGIHAENIEKLPSRLMLYFLIPRWLKMERVLQAFKENDRKSLFLMLMDDPRTCSIDQAEQVIEEILHRPWNKEAVLHYV